MSIAASTGWRVRSAGASSNRRSPTRSVIGGPAIRRARTTYRADGKPISASTSYFRGDLAERAPLLLSPARIREGTFSYVANILKRNVDAWQDQFEPANATVDQADSLGLDKGALIMLGRTWIYDDAGDVLEYGESITYGPVIYRGRLGDRHLRVNLVGEPVRGSNS